MSPSEVEVDTHTEGGISIEVGQAREGGNREVCQRKTAGYACIPEVPLLSSGGGDIFHAYSCSVFPCVFKTRIAMPPDVASSWE